MSKAKVLWEDSNFKILHSCRDYIVVRKDFPYDFHSHFKRYSGATFLIKLYYKQLQPYHEYFKTAMKRITTAEEWDSFTPQKYKQSYYNPQKGRKKK